MEAPSIHEQLVSHLRTLLEGQAVVADASSSGTEEVLLLLEVETGDRAGHAPAHASYYRSAATTHGEKSGLEDAAPANLAASGRMVLHLLLITPYPLFWLEPTSRKRPFPGTGFGNWLRLQTQGARVARVSAGGSGRILRLDLTSNFDQVQRASPVARPGDEPDGNSATDPGKQPQGSSLADLGGKRMTLVLDPLPNASRLIVLNPEGRVEQRFPAPARRSSSGRGVPGHIYKEPGGDFKEPWIRSAASQADPRNARGTSPPLVATYKHPSTLQSDPRNAQRISPEKTDERMPAEPGKLWICAGKGGDSLLEAEGVTRPFLSPIPCDELAPSGIETLSGPWDPLDAARELGGIWIAAARQHEAARLVRQALQAERKHLSRLHKRLASEIEEARRGQNLRRQAEALLASASRVPRGSDEVELDDPSAPGEKITVRLDPARGFAENADRLFRRAGRLERALSVRRGKGEQIATLLGRIESWLQAPDLQRSLAEAQAVARDLEPGLQRRWTRLLDRLHRAATGLDTPLEHVGYEARRAGAAERESTGSGRRRAAAPAKSSAEPSPGWGATDAAAERAGIHPRRYELPDEWIVLVGRSNRENDILTHKVARQRDLWFHARGVAGSHVVLQRGNHKDNPSKDTLAMAAAIAAYYSKARTSRHAPVVYTEKRYVRKPRKAPPGLAVCIREKVLMVTPRLPPGAADSS